MSKSRVSETALKAYHEALAPRLNFYKSLAEQVAAVELAAFQDRFTSSN